MRLGRKDAFTILGAFAILGVFLVGIFVNPLIELGAWALVLVVVLSLLTVLALARPLWVLFVAVALLPEWNYFEIGVVGFTTFELIVEFLFCISFMKWLIQGRFRTVIFTGPRPYLWGFVLAALIGAIGGAPDTIEAINIMRKSVIVPVAFFLLILTLVKNFPIAVKVLLIFVLTNSSVGLYALYVQGVTHQGYRAGFNITSSVLLGISCACAAVICFWLRRHAHGLKRRAVEILLLIQLAVLASTLTRVAIVCLLCMPFLYWVLFKFRHKRPIAYAGAAAGFLLLLFFIVTAEGGLDLHTYGMGTHSADRLTDLSHYTNSLMLRFENWSHGVSVFMDNILFGHGFYPYYKLCPTWQTTKLAHPHSVILNLLITSGIVGTTMFILFFWLALKKIWPTCFGHGRVTGLQRTVLLCLLCMLLNGMVNGIFIWTPIPSLFFCFLGVLLAMQRMLAEEERRNQSFELLKPA